MRILYDSKNCEYKTPFGVLKQWQNCHITLKIPTSCQTKNVKLVFEKENGEDFSVFSMYKDCEKNLYDVFCVEFSISDAGLYFYYFNIETVGSTFDLFKQGERDTNMCAGEKWQLSVIDKKFVLPERFFGRTMYQIFPDRFYKDGECDTNGKCTPFRIHKNWSEIPDYKPDGDGKITNSDFFGGNLKGVTKKLDYLKELGIGIIYLNPIFKAYSNHRYDTCDYRKIDEMLGSETDLKELCKEAHERDIFVILDGVFSHTGSDSVYFDKEYKYGNGACTGEGSPYYKWYSFERFPDKYASWWGIDTLPEVNETDQSYLDFQIDSEDSTLNKWLGCGIDGWRLDVADELPEEFISRFRSKLKEKKSDSLLLGEVWEDASNKISYGKRRRYFVDGELDCVMNYPFRNIIISFVKGEDDGEFFASSVNTIAENYPKDVLLLNMNFLSTHDTARIFTVLGDAECETKDEKAYYSVSGEKKELAYKRLVCAFVLLFVLPGIPSVFYGDEICQEGFEDPFCRRTYDWEMQSPMRALVGKLSKIHSSDVFSRGDVFVSNPESGVVTVKRMYKDKKAILTVNCGNKPFLCEDAENVKLSDGFDGKNVLPYGFILCFE